MDWFVSLAGRHLANDMYIHEKRALPKCQVRSGYFHIFAVPNRVQFLDRGQIAAVNSNALASYVARRITCQKNHGALQII